MPDFTDRRAVSGGPRRESSAPTRDQMSRAPVIRRPAQPAQRGPQLVILRSGEEVPRQDIFRSVCPKCEEPIQWMAEEDGLVATVTAEHPECKLTFSATVMVMKTEVMDQHGTTLVERNGQLFYPRAKPNEPAPGPSRPTLTIGGVKYVSMGHAGGDDSPDVFDEDSEVMPDERGPASDFEDEPDEEPAPRPRSRR